MRKFFNVSGERLRGTALAWLSGCLIELSVCLSDSKINSERDAYEFSSRRSASAYRMVSDATADWLSRIQAQSRHRVLHRVFHATTLRVECSGLLSHCRGVQRGTGPGQSTSQAGLPGLLIGRRVHRERRSEPQIKRSLVVKGFQERGACAIK